MRPSEPLNLGPSPFPRKGKRLHRQLFITLLLTAAHLGAQPADEDPREALVAMGEAITRVQHYRASIERVASLEVAGESNSVQTFASLELEKPNRITFITDNPEGTFEVRSDGEWLTVTVPGSGEILREPAPATMAEIDAATGGLATEGLALASLHMVSDPVAALTEDGHAGEVYEVTGPRLMTFADAVARIAEASGREVRYARIPMDAFKQGLTQAGLPHEQVELLDYLFTTVLDGRNAQVSDGVPRALGRPARDFRDYARGAAARGAWSALASRT